MVTPVRPALSERLAHWLKAEWLLVLFGALALVLALADPQPAARYRHWLQLPTLAGLMGLMIAIPNPAWHRRRARPHARRSSSGWCI